MNSLSEETLNYIGNITCSDKLIFLVILMILLIVSLYYLYKYYNDNNKNSKTILKLQKDYQDILTQGGDKSKIISKLETSINNTVDQIDLILQKPTLTTEDEAVLNNLNFILISLILLAKSIDPVYFGSINEPQQNIIDFKKIVTSYAFDSNKLNKLKLTIKKAEEKLSKSLEIDPRTNTLNKLISVLVSMYFNQMCLQNEMLSGVNCPDNSFEIPERNLKINDNEIQSTTIFVEGSNLEGINLSDIQSITIPKDYVLILNYNTEEGIQMYSTGSNLDDLVLDLNTDQDLKNRVILNTTALFLMKQSQMNGMGCTKVIYNKEQIKENLIQYFNNLEGDNKKIAIQNHLVSIRDSFLGDPSLQDYGISEEDILNLLNYYFSKIFPDCIYQSTEKNWVCADEPQINFDLLTEITSKLSDRLCNAKFDSPHVKNLSSSIHKNLDIDI